MTLPSLTRMYLRLVCLYLSIAYAFIPVRTDIGTETDPQADPKRNSDHDI